MTLENLLNTLIKRGRKPFGIKSDDRCLYYLHDNKIVISYYEFDTYGECNHEDKRCSYRELVSKESGLRQFVCENALYSYTNCVWKGCEGPVVADYIEPQSYEYRLIESSLKNEDELEQFLLQSINVEG